MKFKNLNEAETSEKLFIVQVTDLEYKETEYLASLNPNRHVFSNLSPLIGEALPITKEEWESCVMKEYIEEKTYMKKGSWGYDEKKKYRAKLVKYIPNAKDLIPVYVQVLNKQFGLTDVKKYFKGSGIKIIVTESDKYYPQYGDAVKFSILKIREEDLEKTEQLVKNLKNHIDIGFACPDRRTSASDKLTYR